MTTHHIGDWHIQVTLVQAKLRRYSGQDAGAAFAAREKFDAVIHADLRDGRVELSAALVKPPALTRADHRAIEALLRLVGAETFQADRHGAARELPSDFAPLSPAPCRCAKQ